MTTAPSYNVAYAAAWVVAAIGIVAGVVAGIGATVHPSWLTADVQGTLAIITPCCLALGAILPQVTRTPAAREQAYVDAAQVGKLPDDLAAKHGQAPANGTAPAAPVDVGNRVAALQAQRDAINAQLEQINRIASVPQPALPAAPPG